MNGYDAISDAQLITHTRTAPRPQPATSPQIRPRDTVTPFREAVSANDLEALLSLLCGPEDDERDPVRPGMMEAPLNARRRNALPVSAFALPGRRYPIDTAARARAALSRVEQFGSPEEKRRVRAAVKRRYPDMNVESHTGGD